MSWKPRTLGRPSNSNSNSIQSAPYRPSSANSDKHHSTGKINSQHHELTPIPRLESILRVDSHPNPCRMGTNLLRKIHSNMGASAKEVLEYHKVSITTKGNTLAQRNHIINMEKPKNRKTRHQGKIYYIELHINTLTVNKCNTMIK
eukprot:15331808-Ditylum_brightwellii.AAC.1